MPTEEKIAYVMRGPCLGPRPQSRYLIGMSCECPFGRERLIDIGSASLASSVIARAIESLMLSSVGTNAGAPIASCRDLAPTILAFSNLVSFCGPMSISKPSSAARFPLRLSLEAATVTTKNPERQPPFWEPDKSCASGKCGSYPGAEPSPKRHRHAGGRWPRLRG